MSPVFPFTAVVGQQPVKTALLLALIDPLIGGVLISGARGSAKSTLVRSVQSLLPESALVNLPLGATDEMVTGSIDLQRALQSGDIAFRPGILARAHAGLLYVDEVNLLPDHLVDLLLDVSASGINHLERDGISHQHEARFTLIGSMNPDEGELRPQLQDRFGLLAPVQTTFSLAERRRIVTERLAYDEAPNDLAECHASALESLKTSVRRAKQNLASVIVPDAVRDEIARRCSAAGVEGLRADITLHRACRAQAALAGQSQVTEADLDAVEELVLAHRRRDVSQPGSGPGGRADQNEGDQRRSGKQSQGFDSTHGQSQESDGRGERSHRPEETGRQSPRSGGADSTRGETASGSGRSGESAAREPNNSLTGTTEDQRRESGNPESLGRDGSSIRGAWGAMPAVTVEASAPVSIHPGNVPPSVSASRSRQTPTAAAAGMMRTRDRSSALPGGKIPSGGARFTAAPGMPIDWFRTLADNENLAQHRRGGKGLSTLHRRERQQRRLPLDIVLLDTSGSTLAGSGLATAKGVIRHLSRQAYLGRRHLALIIFGNEQVRTLLPPRRAPKHVEPWLAQVGGGGGTPLGAALRAVNHLLHHMRHRLVDSHLYLVTDGRVRDVASLPACQAALMTVVDIESSGVRLGRAGVLAESMGAGYSRTGAPSTSASTRHE